MARVIFLTDFSEAYARELLLGMARYAHDTAQAWSLCRLPLSIRDKFGIEAVVEWALRMKADAVIGQFYNTDNVELFRKNGIIAIAQDFKKRFTTIPNITGPHYSAGRMAAEYFLQKGFRNFAFYGTRGIDFSDERCQGFRETIEAANPEFTFSSLRSSAQNDLWYYDSTQLITWLQSLPKPVAIMACDDNQAYHITEACLQIEGGGNSRIPNDIAILGVDNDHHLIMIGVGNLGRALLNNFPFENTGFTVDASFDVSPDVIDTQINGIPVYSTDELESYIKRHAVDVVVLTIPQAVAQATANRLIDLGIRGFWNFTNVELSSPNPDVQFENIHFADSLLTLSYRIANH